MATSTPQRKPQVRPHQIALVCALFFNQSSPAWRAILKAHPSNPESYGHLGLLESRQQHYKQAIPLYRKALALDSSALSVHLDLGLALFKTGGLKESIPEFTAVLKAQPANLQVTTLIGMAQYGAAQ